MTHTVYVVHNAQGYTEYPTMVEGSTKRLRAAVDLIARFTTGSQEPVNLEAVRTTGQKARYGRGETKVLHSYKWAYDSGFTRASKKMTLLDMDKAAQERGLDRVGERLENGLKVVLYAHPSRQTDEHRAFIAGQRKAAMLQQPPKAINDGAFTGPLKRDPEKVKANADAWATTATWTENLVEEKPVYYCRFVPKRGDDRTCEVPAGSSLEARAISAVWLRCEPDDPALHVSQIVRR